jgi:hypothetical protein
LSFMNSLSQNERDTLRTVVRTVHMKHYPKDFINQYETDKLIDSLGPEVAESMIRLGIDRGLRSL